MALKVGTKVILTEEVDAPEPEVGTVVEALADGRWQVRWPDDFAILLDHHESVLTEVFGSITPQAASDG